MAEAQDMKASSIKSNVSCHDNRLLSDDDSIDREIVLVRREQELLRTRKAQGQSRASASDGPAAEARHRHRMSGRATSPESVGVHQRLVYESVRSKRTGDRNVSHDLLGELGPDTTTIEPLLSTLPSAADCSRP